MEFFPEDDNEPTLDVPYFDEARSADGWQGQSTTLSFDTLKSHITQAFSRLGGVVHGVQRGSFEIGGFTRPGAQVNYSLEGPNGKMIYGRLDIAALPVKKPKRTSRYQEILRKRMDQSLRAGLYNVVQVLKAQWVLKQMNPAYVPLMPWLLVKGNQTLTELYRESSLPMLESPKQKHSEDDDIAIGEFREVD